MNQQELCGYRQEPAEEPKSTLKSEEPKEPFAEVKVYNGQPKSKTEH
jgi:hypothetical protein